MTPVATGLVTEVLARATRRESVRPDDARAGADYQRVVADGQAYFVKRLSPATDWIMRVTGDNMHRPYLVWRAGIMDKAPSCIDHTVVAMEVAGTGHGIPMSGERLRQQLNDLAEHFDEVMPGDGRYVRQPAQADADGIYRVPPPRFDFLPPLLVSAGLLAVIGTRLARSRAA